MPDFGAWLTPTATQDVWRAYDTARTIAEKPASIIIQRSGGADLDAQTVRIDTQGQQPYVAMAPNASPATMRVIVLGYKDHPTLDDTDLKRGDRFAYEDDLYRVTQILPATPYRLIAIAEAAADV